MSDRAATPPRVRCLNCGAALHGHYCHQCGQQDFDFHRSFGHVFLEALENFFHFDAKFFRNVITLLFRPGRLSAEFNAGRRASQMPPFRLYLFISVLFFLTRYASSGSGEPLAGNGRPAGAEARAELIGSIRDLARENPDPAVRQRLEAAAARLRDPTATNGMLADEQLRDLPAALAGRVRRELATEEARRKQAAPPDTGLDLQLTKKRDTELERYLTERGIYLLQHQREIEEAFLHALPKMLLVCLPFFALHTRVLFRRAGQAYLQHVIVALHYHTFVFLWWQVSHGWSELLRLWSPALAGGLAFAAGCWMFLYPFFMLRRLFAQSWTRTVVKALLLTVGYGLTLGLGFVATALIVFLGA